ncbi:MAG TPA: hypothetical protein VNN21_07620 [Dehalococcoidia bacterium]|nr:hypothetical protein [Dehalococcoidia bacterium]
MSSAFLFNHPGGEHVPRKTVSEYEWNEQPHRRKFVIADAHLAEKDDDGFTMAPRSVEVALWAEWEPPSFCGRFEDDAHHPLLPRAWHRPVVGCTPTDKAQNTDPWVFGETMRYSNCRQERLRRLRELQPGDVLFYGSVKKMDERGCKIDQYGFYLDTVFVIGRSADYRFEAEHPRLPDEAQVDDVFRTHVLDVLGRQARDKHFTLYDGVMLTDSTDQPFCYVPCRPVGASLEDARFPRPRIDDLFGPPFSNPQLGLRKLDLPAEEAWQKVTTRCRERGLKLAARIELPAAGR